MVIECRINDSEDRSDLLKHLRGRVHAELGIECKIELVPPQHHPTDNIRETVAFRLATDYLKKTDASECLLYSQPRPVCQSAAGLTDRLAAGVAKFYSNCHKFVPIANNEGSNRCMYIII